MTDSINFLKSLISTSGLSGFESPVAALIEKEWSPLVDELSRSRLGSVHGFKKGANSTKKDRPSVMIMTHMDAIGLMVTRIVDGFLHVTYLGGVDSRILPGMPVTVHASKGGDLYGVIVMPHAAILPEETNGKALQIRYLLIDTGLLPGEVSKRVSIGDLVSFSTEPVEITGGYLSGHSLDNRASIAALTLCLEALKSKSHAWDVWAVASAQEEVTFAGAYTSSYQIRPTIAIAVDVTFAKGGDGGDWKTHALGKGVALGISPVVHPHLLKRLQTVAEKNEIPFSIDIMPESSQTDADAIQLSADGIPSGILSIPLRYMHTPVEMIAMKDVQRAGRLLAEFVASLELDFMDKAEWE